MRKKNIDVTQEEILESTVREILKLKKQTIKNILSIGDNLIFIKMSLPHGEFGEYVEEKVGFSQRTAQKFMKIAESFHDANAPSCLGVEKLYLLTTIPEKERDKFIEENNIDEMSTRELKKKIKETKNPVTKRTESEPKIIDVEVIEVEEKPIEERTENKEIEPLKILRKAEKIIKEIEIRTGEFYTQNCSIDNIRCDDRGGVLGQLYAVGEITEEELLETVQYYCLDLDINFKDLISEKAKEDYIKNIDNSYSHYHDNKYYIDIVESKDLSYLNTNNFDDWDEDETKEDFIKNYKVEENKITILLGYNENGDENLCVYKNKQLIGHYSLGEYWNPTDEKEVKLLKQRINKLAKFEHIQLEELFNKWLKQYTKYYKKELERRKEWEDSRKREEKYKEKKEHWESIYNYITSFKFEDIYDENCDIKDWEKYKNNDEQYKKYQQRQKDRWKDYDFGNLFGNTQMTVKEEDKPIYKRLYRTLSLTYHPDKIGGDGREMQIVNQLKEMWGV
ncbi:DUF3102 domain-containing protein [Clostridium botulinum]|uniref:DUF3102 domain-containing protein n=1 Tax=Clostridium botulinum TaxID=1491 RepID=UPI001C9AA2EB|nr:DUF3102 domain-containing protein [Clostridium botulinum]MBY6873409.1 DUF3102 domain-containing protein [Clostridium botulinum]